MVNVTYYTRSNRIRTIHTLTHELEIFFCENWQWQWQPEEALQITLYLHLKSKITEQILFKFDIFRIVNYLHLKSEIAEQN
jgi:hypothetical protein